MSRYVCGFLFDLEGADVALIEKAKPAWQKGKLNGIGGAIELGETARQAMAREFLEETGVLVPHSDWVEFAILATPHATIHFFKAFDDDLAKVETFENKGERVHQIAVRNVSRLPHVPNLSFLIPLALDQSGVRLPVLLTDDGRRG
jgi:8-oxo-dGTP diphosphatase